MVMYQQRKLCLQRLRSCIKRKHVERMKNDQLCLEHRISGRETKRAKGRKCKERRLGVIHRNLIQKNLKGYPKTPGAIGFVVQMPLGMPASFIGAPWSSSSCTPNSSLLMYTSRGIMWQLSNWALQPRWETWVEFSAPNLHLA